MIKKIGKGLMVVASVIGVYALADYVIKKIEKSNCDYDDFDDYDDDDDYFEEDDFFDDGEDDYIEEDYEEPPEPIPTISVPIYSDSENSGESNLSKIMAEPEAEEESEEEDTEDDSENEEDLDIEYTE